MTQLTVHQVAQIYHDAGGIDNRTVAWVSVALAESSLRTDAVSPTGAVGLYQVEPYSWPITIGPFSDATDPVQNTRAMIFLSEGTDNFAPWDTAYADIYASGRYTFLSWPEKGSAAWSNMGYVAAALGGIPHISSTPPVQPGLDGSLPGAIAWYRQVSGLVTPALSAKLHRVSARVAMQYTGRR